MALLIGQEAEGPGASAEIKVEKAVAFQFTASSTGTISALHAKLSGTTATELFLGIFNDSSNKVGSLIAEGKVASPKVGENEVSIAGSPEITSGTKYWIALLGTGGHLNVKDKGSSGGTNDTENSNGAIKTLAAGAWAGATVTFGPMALWATGTESGGAKHNVKELTAELSFAGTQSKKISRAFSALLSLVQLPANEITNPNLETATGAWGKGFQTGTVIRSETQAKLGKWSLAVTPEGGRDSVYAILSSSASEWNLGSIYSGQVWVYLPVAGTFKTQMKNPSSTTIMESDQGSVTVTEPEWKLFTWTNKTYNKLDSAKKDTFTLYVQKPGGVLEPSQIVYLDGIQRVRSKTLPAYADGDTTGYYWSAEKGNSQTFANETNFVRAIGKVLTGGLSFSGGMNRTISKPLSAMLSFVGSINRGTARSLVASLTPTGSIGKSISKALSAGLSFVGNLADVIEIILKPPTFATIKENVSAAAITARSTVSRIITNMVTGVVQPNDSKASVTDHVSTGDIQERSSSGDIVPRESDSDFYGE